MKHRIEQDAAQWRLACEALLRERYAMTGLDLEEYRRLEAQVATILPPPHASQLDASTRQSTAKNSDSDRISSSI